MSNNWTREETILALALYCQIPFEKINKHNQRIVELANLIQRTPSAVAMKMCNFGRLDSSLAARGVSGLVHGSRLDEVIWSEFHCNMEDLAKHVSNTNGAEEIVFDEKDTIELPEGGMVPRKIKVRKNQQFFKTTVLSAYNYSCCITGLNIKPLLIASHIKPWEKSDPKTERTNPSNGLCLNALHHKAYDEGIITIDTDFRIIISEQAKDRYTSDVFKDYFERYEGRTIFLPKRFLPSKELIEWHNENIFYKNSL